MSSKQETNLFDETDLNVYIMEPQMVFRQEPQGESHVVSEGNPDQKSGTSYRSELMTMKDANNSTSRPLEEEDRDANLNYSDEYICHAQMVVKQEPLGESHVISECNPDQNSDTNYHDSVFMNMTDAHDTVSQPLKQEED